MINEFLFWKHFVVVYIGYAFVPSAVATGVFSSLFML